MIINLIIWLKGYGKGLKGLAVISAGQENPFIIEAMIYVHIFQNK